MTTTLERVRTAAHARILYMPHGVRQMARPERLISANEVEQVVLEGDLAIITAYLPEPTQWSPDFRRRID